YRDAGSTFGSALVSLEVPGAREPIPPQRATGLMAGHVVALGTNGSRIEFLADVPPEALAASGRSEAARELEERIQAASGHTLPLLLLGASGSGKTYVADRIHRLSRRPGRVVNINCTHLPA